VQWILLGLFFCFAAFLQFRSSGLSIDEDGIHHVSLMQKRRFIPWSAIASVETGTQLAAHGKSLMPLRWSMPLIFLKPKASLKNEYRGHGIYLMVLDRNDGLEPFVISIKPYSMKGLATLAHFLIHKAPHATLDEHTRKLAVGIVPSVFFGEQKGHG
jgi:hypothetical protein